MSDRAWCEHVIGELARHHQAGALDDDPGAGAWLDEIGRALTAGLGQWGCDLDDPRQRGAVATVALVLHQCASTDGSEPAEEWAARLACLLAALNHAVVHGLRGDLEGLAAAAPPAYPSERK